MVRGQLNVLQPVTPETASLQRGTEDLMSFTPSRMYTTLMTTYRFRVKLDWAPTDLWRDIVIGGERTLTDFQTTINDAVGLNQGHLWFIGTDEDYWQSTVKYQRPEEYDDLPSGNPMQPDEILHNAGDTTIDTMVTELALEQYDRLCYLFDYGDEWRFYAILKEIDPEGTADTAPQVVNETGEPVIQYARPGEGRYR